MDAQAEILSLLRAELLKARSRNASYSLRAFAKRLRIQPSALSDILTGKRRVTRKMGEQVLARLAIDPATAATLKSNLRGKYARAKSADTPTTEFQQLTTDQFHVLSDWFHFAARSLSETKDFRDDPAWIAQRLGIPKRDARLALERLDRLGLIERDDSGVLRSTLVQLTTSHEVQDAFLRQSHLQHLDLARDALESGSVEERDITGITMAIDPKKIPEAKERIRKFRRELCAFLESGARTEVFRLNVQLFPMSKKEVTK